MVQILIKEYIVLLTNSFTDMAKKRAEDFTVTRETLREFVVLSQKIKDIDNNFEDFKDKLNLIIDNTHNSSDMLPTEDLEYKFYLEPFKNEPGGDYYRSVTSMFVSWTSFYLSNDSTDADYIIIINTQI
jgi:hypothetical protein